MKKIIHQEIFKMAVLIVMSFIFGSSCQDKEEVPDYVGTWKTTKSIPVTTGYASIDYSLTLRDQSFTETFITNYDPRLSYPVDARFATINGSVTVTGNRMKLTIHKVSISKYNPETAVVSDPTETFTFEDDDFGFNSESIWSATSNNNLEFEVVGNQLIVTVDYNNDGIYAETEKHIYIRQ